jgi:hypothetical protein
VHFPRPDRPAHTIDRRTLASAAIAVGAVLGVLTLTGVTAASAYASVDSASGSTSAMTAFSPVAAERAEALSEITTAARVILGAARSAIVDAQWAEAEVAASGLDVGITTTVDTTALSEQIDRLDVLDILPLLLLPGIADDTETETKRVMARTEALRASLSVAQAAKAAEEAAAQAQREAEAAAAALAAANTPEGAQATARQIAASEYGWGDDQFSCLVSLWNRESNWNYQAYNAGSGATGIPQALPGSKMASAGADWQTNATTQIRWGLGYIAGSYGTPCAAWGHSQATSWY